MAARANGSGVSCSRVSLGEMEQRFEQDPQVPTTLDTSTSHRPGLSLSEIIVWIRGHLTIVSRGLLIPCAVSVVGS